MADVALADAAPPLPPAAAPRETDVAAILYTSGTTGQPKGAMLTRLSIAHSVLHYQACMRLRPEDRSALAVPAMYMLCLLCEAFGALDLSAWRIGGHGGFKVYSVEVENVLMAWPGVVDAAIVGKPCPVLGERVHAFVYAPGIAPADDALKRHCAERLAGYKLPESITWSTDPLPRNANGKLLKRAMRATT